MMLAAFWTSRWMLMTWESRSEVAIPSCFRRR